MTTAMPTVKELVVPLEQFPHLSSEESVHEAVGQLFSHTANGSGKLMFDELIVTNAEDQYVGRLTIQGILTCFFPTLFNGQQKQVFAGKNEKYTNLAILMEDSFQVECRRQGALPVSLFMVPPHKSIKADMHPLHAAEIMMEENETCLPVVEDQALIGVVRLIDIFRSLAGSCSL
ncbi:MAG: CBS domain-containing protein [Desulfobulbus sp.]|nr:CBS domain-containing protein [Desulfobulbus sp.]